jgi:ATP-dependent Lon protease
MFIIAWRMTDMTIVPIYNVIALPDVNIYFQTDIYKKTSGRVPFKGERVTMIVAREYRKRNDYTEDSFYPIGLSGEITEVSDDGYLVIHTGSRVNIDEITVYGDHTIELSVSKRSDIYDIDDAELADRLESIKEMMTESLKNTNLAAGSTQFLGQFDSVAAIAAAVSPWLSTSNEERYAILAEDSVAKRTELIEKMLYENYEMFRVNTEARSAQEQEYHKIYREGAIKKQMEYLQKELDEMHPEKVSDVRRLEIKIEESGMNETARHEADKVLNRLKQEGANSAESGMLHDYLDFLVGLSWKKEEARTIDLEKAEKILEEDHYGLKKVK